MHKLKLNQKGIGLIEVLAGLGIAVIVLTSLVSLSLMSLRSSLNSKLLLEGTKIANREMELVRAFRDRAENWQNDSDPGFIDEIIDCKVATPCHMNLSSITIEDGFDNGGGGPAAVTRYFFATDIDGGELVLTDEIVRVQVVASWKIGDDTKSTSLYTDLSNWEHK